MLADDPVLPTAVRCVTDIAIEAALRFVDMKKVEIQKTVTEARFLFVGQTMFGQCLGMASITKTVFLDRVACVDLRRERSTQQPRIHRTMGLMAVQASSFLNRIVELLPSISSKSSENTTRGRSQTLLMTRKAEIFLFHRLETLVFRAMRPMTTEAAALLCMERMG
jgi:hypothetical protein